MPARRQIDAKLAEEAAQWVERLSRDSSRECDEQFADWLMRTPNHIDEFLVAKLTYTLFQQFDPQRQIDVEELVKNASRQVVQLRDGSPAAGELDPQTEIVATLSDDIQPRDVAASPLRRFRRSAWLAAACVAVLSFWSVWFYQYSANTYSTGLGERRSIRLEDGSFIELNTRSKVRVRFAKEARSVQLLEGEALFKVAHDTARPFLVSTQAVTVRAIGTQFDVYVASASDTRVTVVEGRVQVLSDSDLPKNIGAALDLWDKIVASPPTPNARLVTLAAGEQARVSGRGQIVTDAKPDVSNAVAWRNGRLIFHDSPVGEVIKEFSRYSDFRFALVGDGLAQRRISGVFHADDPQTLVSLFEGDQSVEVNHTENGVVVRLR